MWGSEEEVEPEQVTEVWAVADLCLEDMAIEVDAEDIEQVKVEVEEAQSISKRWRHAGQNKPLKLQLSKQRNHHSNLYILEAAETRCEARKDPAFIERIAQRKKEMQQKRLDLKTLEKDQRAAASAVKEAQVQERSKNPKKTVLVPMLFNKDAQTRHRQHPWQPRAL